MWSRLGRLSPTTRNWLNLDWYKLCSSWKSPGPFGITSSLQAFGKVEEGSLRSLPVFSPSYKEEQYMTRREYKKKERLKEEWPGEEEEEDVDEEKGQNEVPQAVFRKKMRTTGTAPKLFRHLYPDSEYFYLGKIDLSHVPEALRRAIPFVEVVMERRAKRSPTWVSKLWKFLENDPKEALTRVNQILAMLPQGVSLDKFFKQFPALLFDDNMRLLEMGEACVSLMDKVHHFRIGYKYGIYDMDNLLEVYRKGKRMCEAWEILKFDHGWSKKQFLEAVELSTTTFGKFAQSVIHLTPEQIIEIISNPSMVENRIRRFSQVFRNYNSKKHFFTYYSYIVRADSEKFSRFLDIFLALSPVRVEVGGVTSHQVEAIFEAFDILRAEMESKRNRDQNLSEISLHLPKVQKAIQAEKNQMEESGSIGSDNEENKTTWTGFIENFKFALADKECREVLMYEFKKSKETGKRKRLRKALLEALDAKGVISRHDHSEELRLQAVKISKHGPSDLWML